MDWQAIFNAIDDPAMILDLEFRILAVNEKTITITGISSDELIGRYCYEIFHKRSSPPEGCPFEALLASQNPQTCAMEIEILDRLYMVSVSPLFDATGKLEKILHIARDITEQRETEAALIESEEKYRLLVENSADLHYRANIDGKITFISRSVEELSGYSVAETLGRNMSEAYNDPKIRDQLLATLKEDGFARNFTTQFQRKDGSLWWGSGNLQLYKDKSGRVIGVEGVVRDITQQKMMEIFLQQSERKFRAMMEAMSDSVYICSADYRVEYMNPAMIKRTGRDATGEFCYTALHDLDQHCPWCKRKSGLKGHTFESEITSPKDQRSYLITSSPLQNEDGSLSSMIVFRDTTERQRMAKELSKVRKLESVGVLAGGIAHDFNNILAAILGNISLALSWSKPNDEIYKLLKESEKASLRAKDLTQQLLTFAKGGEPIKKITSIEEVIKDSAAFVLRGSKVRCVFSLAEKLKPVEIDSGQISQVVQNLIINASQAMPNGGVITITGQNCKGHKSDPFAGQYDEFIEIVFKDQGIGIAKELIDQIFDPYFTTKQRGSGLGLAITHSIIAKHEGHIMVASEPGQGTEFTIYLPACQEKLSSSAPPTETASQKASGRIMIMDDEEMIRELVLRILSRKGYQVVTAADGDEAIQLYQEARGNNAPIDLVIMDLTIPGGMGGKEAVGKILELDPKARVMISSGYANDPVMANYKEYGFMATISKPFQIRELVETMEEVLSR